MLTTALRTTLDEGDVLDHDPRWCWDYDGTPKRPFLLWLVTDGSGSLTVGDETQELRPGACTITDLSQPHHGRQDPDNLLCIYWIRFSYSAQVVRQASAHPLPRMHRRIVQVSFLRELMERSIRAYQTKKPSSANQWLESALLEIANVDNDERLRGAESVYYQAMHGIAEQIKGKPATQWSIPDLCRPLSITPDHFIRVFKRIIGRTPGEYVLECRMDSARHLLRYSGMSITAISDELGYCDVHHFSRQFALRMGISPSMFRKTY